MGDDEFETALGSGSDMGSGSDVGSGSTAGSGLGVDESMVVERIPSALAEPL